MDEAIVFLSDIVKLTMGICGTDLSRLSQVLLKRRLRPLRLFHGRIGRGGPFIGGVDRVESVHGQSVGVAPSLLTLAFQNLTWSSEKVEWLVGGAAASLLPPKKALDESAFNGGLELQCVVLLQGRSRSS
ncbi:hypothetical protein NLM16_05465 [Bradyrhizobium brasilense]|uniref:hypothetical protein n=1 Tax=Bradyrhizobium brasilense TaxID=1419277 RepID=UPI00287814BF|nr:hypothetical protein [Bradyrhizobium brasilense]MCP3413545.1 hypothetical protein [Bradyrhizobium brasilense]